MKQPRRLSFLLLGCGLLTPAACPADEDAAKVTVRPYSIREERQREIETGDLKPGLPRESFLQVTLLLEGAAVATATHASDPVVVKATDNLGTALNRGGGGADRFDELNREHMWFFQDKKPQDKIKVDVQLAAPPRGATQLTHLEGSVTLKQIRTEDHLFGGLAARAGKEVEDPVLEKAGVKLKILGFDPKQSGEVLKFQLNDPEERVQDYDLVDASGEKVSSGHGAFGSGKSMTVSLSAFEEVPATAKLRLTMTAGEPAVITVPFKITEPVDLP